MANKNDSYKYYWSDKGKVTRKAYYKSHKAEIAKCKKEYERSHRDEVRKRKREYYRAHPEKQKDHWLKANYRMSLKDFDAMLGKQFGACAICYRPLKEIKRCVDHDHRTGVVRGIVCHWCNTGLGNFNDDPALLRRAAKYLLKRIKCKAERHQMERRKIKWKSKR